MRGLLHKFLRSQSGLAQFLRFAVVGVKISAIDIAGVYLLPLLVGWHVYVARLVSLSSALMAGYLLNRYFTFGGTQRGSFFRQMAGHFGVHLTGGVLNYGTFMLILHLGHANVERPLNLTPLPLFALVIGGVVGMTFNFIVSRRFVFKQGQRRGEAWYWSFWGLLLDSMGRAVLWWLQSLGPRQWRAGGLNARRFLFLFVVYPLGCLLQAVHWLGFLLDEVLFRGYRKCDLKGTVMITGIPRSGTTFLHRVLAADSARFTHIKMWEAILAPAISEKYLLLALRGIDRRIGSPLWRGVCWLTRRCSGDFDAVHAVDWNAAEEDYLLLLPVSGCFIAVLAFPFSPWLWSLGNLENGMPQLRRRELLGFYRSCLQRHLYVFGKGRSLVLKNAAFGTWIRPLSRMEPHWHFILCVREPQRAMASQLSSVAGGIKACGTEAASSHIHAQLHAAQAAALEEIHLFQTMAHRENAPFILDHAQLKRAPQAVFTALGAWLARANLPVAEAYLQAAANEAMAHHSAHHYPKPARTAANAVANEACQRDAYADILAAMMASVEEKPLVEGVSAQPQVDGGLT